MSLSFAKLAEINNTCPICGKKYYQIGQWKYNKTGIISCIVCHRFKATMKRYPTKDEIDQIVPERKLPAYTME